MNAEQETSQQLSEEISNNSNSEKQEQCFPSGIKFKFDWRDYQQRVLNDLEMHLDDNHLHIIAPPGSGKTILGLEVTLRLNKPALILAPTVSIRNQWIHRFTEMFLQLEKTPDWVSRDLKSPKLLTVVTYQALHAACTGEDVIEEEDIEEEEDESTKNVASSATKTKAFIALLESKNIGTIVVDEAHHLKNAWWKSLSQVKNALKPTIVGLTATPPYDVSYAEWQRYSELNGPVDAEISVPELVVEGDLCPHQDYVCFSLPSADELSLIERQREKMKSLFESIKLDRKLREAIRQHSIIKHPNNNLEWIYSNLEYYSASLIYLNATEFEVRKEHLEVIGDAKFKIPELNFEWLQILLKFYLFEEDEGFADCSEHKEELSNRLKHNGALNRSSVNFQRSTNINKALGSSIVKLKSIDRIVKFEHEQLKEDLRMVVLTDYIRKEFLVESSENDLELNKIGVLPIFEMLRRTKGESIKLGVLTGSIVIIPASTLTSFEALAQKKGIERINSEALPYDPNYLIIHSNSKLKHDIVHLVTQIFEAGGIEVIVGTKSLLGEGWDAPSINSLILASFVGSYVLSNQMRGRAIRTERLNTGKTGNIWHLVCIDPLATDGGLDMELLRRRFKAFVGISFEDGVGIQNGFDRLNVHQKLNTPEDLYEANRLMFNYAAQREGLKEEWRLALENGYQLVEEVRMPFDEDRDYQAAKSMYLRNTIKWLIFTLGSILPIYIYFLINGVGRMGRVLVEPGGGTFILMFALVLAIAMFGGLAFRTLRLYIKYRDIYKDIQKIGNALMETMVNTDMIQTPISKLKVISSVDEFGGVYCNLEGGTTYESSTFIKSLQEIVSVVDNPKYLIIRKSSIFGFIKQKDYHSVPDAIGKKKKHAKLFGVRWAFYVGRCELVYARSIQGRKMLLLARIKSLASEFQEKTERVNRWK